MRRSILEKRFIHFWGEYADSDLPTPVEEHRFHPTRLWRLDYAWPELKVGVEIQGGTYAKGRHSRGAGQEGDYEKHNAAVIEGWRVLILDSKACQRKNMGATIAMVSGFVRSRIDHRERVIADMNAVLADGLFPPLLKKPIYANAGSKTAGATHPRRPSPKATLRRTS